MNSRKIFFWNTITNLLAAPLRFALNLFLASCLLPKDFGAMVVPSVIVGISLVLIDSGLKSSLIQKTTLKEEHCSTVFFANLLIASVLAILFCLLAFPIQFFFQIPNLGWLIIFASFTIIIRSTALINEARLQILGSYGKLITVETVSYILGYGVAIFLAKNLYGPFSLVGLALVSAITYSIGLFIVEPFYPKLRKVSKKLFFVHWRMGKNLLGQGLLENFSEKIDEVLLGKFIGITSLGLYSKGREYSSTLGVIGSKFFARPWFSVMSNFSSNKVIFASRYKTALLVLITGGIFLISFYFFYGEFFIKKTLGAEWEPLVPLFKYFIISTAFYYIVTFNKYTFLALGKPEINLKIEIFYTIARIVGLLTIFLFFTKSQFLLFFLIGLDVIVRLLMVILQSAGFAKLFDRNIKYYINLVTIALVFFGVFSILNTNLYFYGALLMLWMVVFLVVFLFDKKILK